MESFYSFDTSVFINGRRDLLPPATFPSVWQRVEGMIADGAIRAVDEVERELAKREGDAVHSWAKDQADLFVDLEEDIQTATSWVLTSHPKLLGNAKGRNGADPFVIGLAVARDGVVVTQETQGSLAKPKIPSVCEAMNVRCLTLVEFITEQGWSF
ncbi:MULTISPECIES: DUF4411 family protein [Isoptericola]|uniref:DUF4411 family protein n=2 Tax=Isoptericola TaxID=254250 RepID=A0ABN2JV09_9MICO|nr:DUF4411 family protein [Isoptericola cucumis]GGI11405.1 hypothetical protein GCM10007368_36040 [Isoptericola cucumis]